MVDIEAIGVSFDTSGLVKGQRALKDTEQAANKTADAADKVGAKGSRGFKAYADAAAIAERQTKDLADTSTTASRLMGAALAGLAVSQLIGLTDQYTKFTAQLKLATNSTAEYASAYSDVARISKAAQSDLGATGTLYARIANGTRELGVSQQRVADITEVTSLALKVSGATASESASAMLQLSQAFASGQLRGEEFNAVNEAAPRLMKALADGIGVPVGALREMATEGKITSQVMAVALPKALEDLRKEATQVQTIAGSFTLLKNSVMEFVGTEAQASGAVSALTSGIALLANNIDTLAAVALGFGAAKFAETILRVGVETQKAVAGTLSYVAAQQAQKASSVAAAQAEVARTEAMLAQAAATKTAIAISREEMLAKLAVARADISAAQASMAAASAAGTQSFALRVLKDATNELAAAEARRAAMVAELALLGQQQARVSAQITAATVAQATAQTALGKATSASMGILSRAVGFLGGPIGAITALLGLGATAWALWGNNAETAEDKASKAIEESTQDIITRLDAQIKKLQERNALAAGGLPGLAQSSSPEAARMASLRAQISRAQAGTDEFSGLNEEARLDIVRKLGVQYGELYARIQAVNVEQEKLANAGKQSKMDAWLAKNQKFLTDAEKLALAIKEAKADLGDAFSPDVEKRIRDSFAQKGAKSVNKELEEQAKLLAELAGLSGSFAEDWARLNTMYAKGKLSVEQLTEAQSDLLAKQPAIKAMHEAEEKAIKAEKQAREEYIKLIDRLIDKTESLHDQVSKQEEYNARIGLSKEAIAALDEQKLENIALSKDEAAALADLVDLSGQMGDMYRDQAEQLRKLAELKKQGATKEVAAERVKKEAEEAQKILDNLRENVQRNLGDELFNMLDGNFKNIGDSFKRMLMRMVANAMAADLMSAMGFGKAGGGFGSLFQAVVGGGGGMPATGVDGLSLADNPFAMAAFDGGGFTGSGPRSGGLDGKGGFLAMMHPQETVIDHTRGQSAGKSVVVNYAPVYNIDSKTDRTELIRDLTRMQKATIAEMEDRLERAS